MVKSGSSYSRSSSHKNVSSSIIMVNYYKKFYELVLVQTRVSVFKDYHNQHTNSQIQAVTVLQNFLCEKNNIDQLTLYASNADHFEPSHSQHLSSMYDLNSKHVLFFFFITRKTKSFCGNCTVFHN